ncbi:MAG: radical protein [Myxococcaceae bacterium]|nr:radical protein [Myxococcaceae bacterium]
MLNLATIVDRTEAEGPGARFAVWVQGCPLRCPGCCNPAQLAFVPRDAVAPEDLAARAIRAGVEGVSLLGGEPFAQAAALARFAALVRAAGLSVMVYSGYTLAELRARSDAGVDALLAATDLLVDGRYVAALRTDARRWIGSTNQSLHFLTDRYAPGDACFSGRNTVEIHLRDGELVVNGWPALGALTGRKIIGGSDR